MGRPKKRDSIHIPELARYKRELPPLPEVLLLAALLAQRPHRSLRHARIDLEGIYDSPKDAFRRAVKFYAEVAELHEAYAKASPFRRALFCGESEAELQSKWQDAVNAKLMPKEFPATYDEFLKLIVKGKDEADSTKRLRGFFYNQCPQGQDAEGYAAQQLAALKEEGFKGSVALYNWLSLAHAYRKYWKEYVSNLYRTNRKGKTKNPLSGT